MRERVAIRRPLTQLYSTDLVICPLTRHTGDTRVRQTFNIPTSGDDLREVALVAVQRRLLARPRPTKLARRPGQVSSCLSARTACEVAELVVLLAESVSPPGAGSLVGPESEAMLLDGVVGDRRLDSRAPTRRA